MSCPEYTPHPPPTDPNFHHEPAAVLWNVCLRCTQRTLRCGGVCGGRVGQYRFRVSLMPALATCHSAFGPRRGWASTLG